MIEMYTEYYSKVKFNGFMKLTQALPTLKIGLEIILIILSGKELQSKHMVKLLTTKLKSFIKIFLIKKLNLTRFCCKTQGQGLAIG